MKSRFAMTLAVVSFVLVGWPRYAWAVKDVVCRVEVDRPVLVADRGQTAVVKVVLDAPEADTVRQRPPVNLAVVLDRSGSMSGQKIEKAKEAAIAALRRLNAGDLFSLVMYDHEVTTVVPAQSAANSEWIESRIRSISSRGNTALFAGVSQGAAEVRKHIEDRGYVHRVILLSDGLANVGPSSPADLERLGAALLKEGISVTTVGVGNDYNEDLMTRLSTKSDGNCYFVESSSDLPRIFAAELGDVLSVVARKVIIEIECPDGVRPVRIVGRDGRIRGRTAHVHLNQLYGGQSKYALLEVEVPPQAAGRTLQLANARCLYDNALTHTAAVASGAVAVRFDRDETVAVKNVDREVQTELELNVAADVNDTAVGFMDQGKKDEAVRLLRRQSAELRKKAAYYDNGKLNSVAASLDQQAQRISEEGLSSRDRKVMRNSNAALRNGQVDGEVNERGNMWLSEDAL